MRNFSVMFEAQPINVQRFAVIMMVRLRLKVSAYPTRKFFQSSITNGI